MTSVILKPRRRCLFAAAALVLGGLAAPAAQAQAAAWPTKPIRLVVGYAAGGATDVVARLVAGKLGERLGQSVMVDNRTGANSNIGAEAVAHAPADGYTLYVYTVANTVNASLYEKLGYDPLKDFEPIGLIARVPNVLVVNPALPAKNVAEFVKLAQAPAGLSFASSGSGSTIHLSGELFKVVAKANLLHVPYRGSAPALTDLMGGQVQAMFDNTPSVLPHVKAGKLRALAITSAQRSPLLPDVPTLAESGFPGFDVQSWFSLAAPAGTPRAVITRLNSELNKVLAEPDIAQRLRDMAATPEPGTPAQLQQLITSEAKRWREVIKQAGIKPD
ncbi:tripartite tricarboxylate transporter substrate binding protein [Ideonella azotifigens]|uniref:Tripartite tricarboxylate transporter substrate binding protein n=2 Tax=Ideonella azotifigens TaxID=513160 RepID=A0ABN1JK90_9BURK|nr:tripartite tricarboxylate transporter substrate binding protein [Ideonella azotifigens]MCD2341883.1 tripartite tricarboxylate transporter substrate binding protein [Ideonella azotifigens]